MGLFNRNKDGFDKTGLTTGAVKDFRGKFPEYAGQFKDMATEAGASHDFQKSLREFKQLWGVSVPAELQGLLRDLHTLNYPKFSRWECSPLNTSIANEPGNIVEKILLTAQVEYPTDHHVDWFSGSVSLDPVVNGSNSSYRDIFSFQYPIYEANITNRESPQIYIYQHGGPDIWSSKFEVMAKDVSAFLYFMMMFHSHDRKKISDTNFSNCQNRVASEVKLPYYFFNSFKIGRRWISTYNFNYRPPSQQGSSITMDYFQRAKWIIELLKGNHDNYLWSLQRSVYQRYLNPKIDATRHRQNMEHLPHHVPDALYYLFRCFFREGTKNNYLKEYIRICKQSDSRIIRDAAELVEQFNDGKTFFGEIDNIHTLRKDFRANMNW